MPEHSPAGGRQTGTEFVSAPGSREIEALRPARNPLDPDRPYHFIHELERGPHGLERVNTLFLTGKECAFKCLMCDLWKNTLKGPTPPGAIVRQLDYALVRLPDADTIKLYNNGNFFDPKAVPTADHPAMLQRLQGFKRVIVENHPNLTGEACLRFRDGLKGGLEVAMGLECIHPEVLPRLNKQLVPDDFRRAAGFLLANNIRVRAFVLLNPPYLTDRQESIHWALETVRFAFECGVHCCSIIATRPGNGVMETLLAAGHYIPPTLDALEEVFDKALVLAREAERSAGDGVQRLVFVDTWDIGFFSSCPRCFAARKVRLEKMNLEQIILQPTVCDGHA